MNTFSKNNSKYLGFIRTSALLFALLFCSKLYAFEGLRFGLVVTPQMTWLKADAGDIERGKVRGGVKYGLLLDLNVTENYIISTGVNISLVGGNVEYQDSLLYLNRMKPANTDYILNTQTRLKYQYLNIPIIFKLRTNEIGYFHYFGSFGLLAGFNIKARADVDVNGENKFDNENISKRKGNTSLLVAKIFNLGLEVGGGFEYNMTDNTSLMVGIFYNNGFLDIVDDGDNDKILVHAMGLQVGVLF